MYINNISKDLSEQMSKIIQFLEQCIPEKKISIFGEGKLLLSCIPYYSLCAVMMLGYHMIFQHPWFLVALIYAILPLFDQLFVRDFSNPTEQQRKKLQERDFQYKLCLYITVALDWFIFIKVMHHISSYQIQKSGFYNLLGIFFVYTNLNATQFTLAHQIYHKPGFFNKFLGTFHMSKNLNAHFSYQHLYGHHRKVATPEDPASAPQDMPVYRFFWKSFIGTYKSVYYMEKQQNKDIYQNCAILSFTWSIVFTCCMFAIFGVNSGIFFICQAAFSVFLLETINYIQHYGLTRDKLQNGQYEKVTIKHSWNAAHRFTNYLLFKLQRHSDHHENAMKPYQTLLSISQSPQLPHGYSLMVSMALFPNVWFRIMDPLVNEYKRAGDGSVKTEITERAIYESRIFAIKIALAATSLWILEYLL